MYKITLHFKGTGIRTGRFSQTALPLLYTGLGAVNVSTMKDDVLWFVDSLILHELGWKPHTISLVSMAFLISRIVVL